MIEPPSKKILFIMPIFYADMLPYLETPLNPPFYRNPDKE